MAGAVTEENNFLLMRERDSELVIRISGTWRLKDGLPSMDGVKKEIERPPHARLVLFDTRELAGWDSSVVSGYSSASVCREAPGTRRSRQSPPSSKKCKMNQEGFHQARQD